MADQASNPIQGVRPKDSSSTYTVLPPPSKYDWKFSDVSSADAGRTEDGLMHKMRIAQKSHIELEWQNRDGVDMYAILNAFDPEYVEVNHWDYKQKAFVSKVFYVGDRTVTTYSRIMDIETLAFNIIEQ